MIIDRIWASQPGAFFFLSTKDARGKWKDHPFSRHDIRKIGQFIDDNRDKDLYFCAHGFSQPKRRKEFAVLPKLCWSDMDEVDPRTVKPKPTIAFESSPGRYVGLWLTDKTVTEEMNRALVYSIGADKSGWDLTQVLRIPGTVNYKYTSQPKTRILWSDGDTILVSSLPKPKHSASKNDNVDTSDAAEVFKKYENKLPRWLRKELINGKPAPGKRSEMIWKMEQTLVECGVSTGEALTLIKASAWNKFAGRRNEDEQLRRELDKAVNKHINGAKAEVRKYDDDNEDEARLIFRPMDEVEEEEIDWIYYPYMALGELTILEGDPGLGKSYLMQMIAGHLCDGLELPSIKKMKPIQGRVVYFDMENSAATVTKKRLVGNGFKRLDRFIQCEEPFSIDDDEALDTVYDYLEKHRPVAVVFDTINTYLGKSDAFKGHEAQQAFARFREIASRFHCSVVVLRHLTKSTKERALYRGQGNIAFAGMARSVITVGRMPDEPELRVMAITKLNIGRAPPALSFSIQALPDTLKHRDRSVFEWGEFIDDLTADDIVAQQPAKDESKSDEAARTMLDELMADGEVELSRVEKMAEARSIPKAALKRAITGLEITRDVRGFGKDKKTWLVPPQTSGKRHRMNGSGEHAPEHRERPMATKKRPVGGRVSVH